ARRPLPTPALSSRSWSSADDGWRRRRGPLFPPGSEFAGGLSRRFARISGMRGVCALLLLLAVQDKPGDEKKMEHKHTNRLAKEKSPYLLQHAHNPVDWYPWGAEAFEKAKKEDKPIFLSVGYSTCHWCHVMERESFEDEATASIMNEHFVNIKIDREERPDLD